MAQMQAIVDEALKDTFSGPERKKELQDKLEAAVAPFQATSDASVNT